MKKSTPHTSIYSESVFAVLCVLSMILITMVLPDMGMTDAEMIYGIIGTLVLGLMMVIGGITDETAKNLNRHSNIR